MNALLIFFALPLATIVISIALQRIFRNPLLVAAIIFSIFLIVTFIINDLNFLIATIIYAIISFITAYLIKIICKLFRCIRNNCSENDNNETIGENYLGYTNENNLNCETLQNGTTARINVIPNCNANDIQYRTSERYRR